MSETITSIVYSSNELDPVKKSTIVQGLRLVTDKMETDIDYAFEVVPCVIPETKIEPQKLDVTYFDTAIDLHIVVGEFNPEAVPHNENNYGLGWMSTGVSFVANGLDSLTTSEVVAHEVAHSIGFVSRALGRASLGAFDSQHCNNFPCLMEPFHKERPGVVTKGLSAEEYIRRTHELYLEAMDKTMEALKEGREIDTKPEVEKVPMPEFSIGRVAAAFCNSCTEDLRERGKSNLKAIAYRRNGKQVHMGHDWTSYSLIEAETKI